VGAAFWIGAGLSQPFDLNRIHERPFVSSDAISLDATLRNPALERRSETPVRPAASLSTLAKGEQRTPPGRQIGCNEAS
jgi:hypothetical protein